MWITYLRWWCNVINKKKDILMDNVLSHMYYIYIISPLLKTKFGCTLFTINLYFNSSQYYPTLDKTFAIALSLHIICFIIRLYSCNINFYLVNLWFFVLHFVHQWDGIVISKHHEWVKCISKCFKDKNKANHFVFNWAESNSSQIISSTEGQSF